MSLVTFQDLPNTTTPINAANLNNNFDEIKERTGTLIWTNNNPSNDFSAQTIQLDLSDYDYIDIIANSGVFRSLHNGNYINMIRMQDSNGNWSGSWFIDMRIIQVNSNSVVFHDNRGQNTNNSNSYVIRNNHNIPLYIIGYKYS